MLVQLWVVQEYPAGALHLPDDELFDELVVG